MDLGLTYIPTFKLLLPEDTLEAQRYITRRISLYDYFQFHGSSDENQPSDFRRQFTSGSKWTPSTKQISDLTLNTIDDINTCTQNQFNGKYTTYRDKTYITHKCKPNLTPQQLRTIKDLRNNSAITIKPADKGGAVVVMDSDLYRQEALRQLTNKKYYAPLEAPRYPETAQTITHILRNLRNQGYITDKQLSYLKPDINNMKARYFYLLPKIHKSRTSWPHNNMPAGRPIVSDCDSESSRVCAFIDYFLQPLSNQHPSYLKDTYDFIAKIRDQVIDPSWLLITADVESLYTNMNIDLILQSVAEIFQEFPDLNRSDDGILQLLELILRNNDFEFDGNFYLQLIGVGMGRRFAPSAANIYLRKFDYQAMHGFHIQPKLFCRFLDDIFGIWPGTRESLEEYQTFLNQLIPGIRVTFTARQEIIEFLDTHVYKHIDHAGICRLKTKVYFKPTDTHQLLHRSSFHPSHTFRGIVKSQFIRFKRISSTFQDYQQACATLMHTLHIRGYKKAELLKQKRNIWLNYDITPKRLHSQDNNNNKEIIPVVTFFDNFNSRLNRRWTGLIRANPVFEEARVISAYKRHKNLRDLLVRGRFGSPYNPKDTEDDDNTEALLDALIEVINRSQ